ncbi:MAG: hypothetical protein V4466_17695 [Pseudomonadota bacterium]
MFPAGVFVVLLLILAGVGLVVAGTLVVFGGGWAMLAAGAMALILALIVSRGLNG